MAVVAVAVSACPSQDQVVPEPTAVETAVWVWPVATELPIVEVAVAARA